MAGNLTVYLVNGCRGTILTMPYTINVGVLYIPEGLEKDYPWQSHPKVLSVRELDHNREFAYTIAAEPVSPSLQVQLRQGVICWYS